MSSIKICLASLISLFTRIPLKGDVEFAARCSWLTPLLGFAVGVIEALPLLLHPKLPILEAALWLALHVAVTGGIHLDGLLDYADVLMPGFRGDKALRVMKDPHRGSGAILAATVYSLLFVSSASIIVQYGQPYLALLVSGVSYSYAYTVSLYFLSLSPREPYPGLARLFQDNLESKGRRRLLYTGLAIAAILLVIWNYIYAIIVYVLALMTGFAVYRDSVSRLGFMNGDAAGACIETVRLAFIVATALFLSLSTGF